MMTFKPAFLVLIFAFLLAACSSENNPLSAVGLGSKPEPIDYSARAPLVMPPADSQGQLPPPQEGQPQPYVPSPNALGRTEIAPPPETYSQNTPGAVVEEKSWWQRNFGN